MFSLFLLASHHTYLYSPNQVSTPSTKYDRLQLVRRRRFCHGTSLEGGLVPLQRWPAGTICRFFPRLATLPRGEIHVSQRSRSDGALEKISQPIPKQISAESAVGKTAVTASTKASNNCTLAGSLASKPSTSTPSDCSSVAGGSGVQPQGRTRAEWKRYCIRPMAFEGDSTCRTPPANRRHLFSVPDTRLKLYRSVYCNDRDA